MSKALKAAQSFEDIGIDAELLDALDSPDFERYLGLPIQDDQVLGSKTDGTREWITIITEVNWGEIQGTLSNQTDLWSELQNRYVKSETYSKTEHISISNGVQDGGKPIVLNGQGQIDPSMMDASSFYYVGPWDASDPDGPQNPQYGTCDPVNGCEYPDISGEEEGAFWVCIIIANPDDPIPPDYADYEYTFLTGDLVGKTITQGDFMVYGSAGWSIMRSEMNPLLYYKLDGSHAITAPFAGGGQQFKQAADGTDATDLVTKNQLDNQSHTISDITDLQPELDSKVNKSGDTMTGTLVVETDEPRIGLQEIDTNTRSRLLVSDGVTYLQAGETGYGNAQSSGNIYFTGLMGGNVKEFKVQRNDTLYDIWHSGNFNPDTKENYLNVPTNDGMILSSDTAGNRSWIQAPNSAVWGQISGTLSNQTDLWNELEKKAETTGDTFTGDVNFDYDIFIGKTGTGSSIINFWSESESTYIPVYLDQNDGKLHVESELYSSKFISSAGTIRTGYNVNNNSVYEFTDPSGPEIPTIFWHNLDKDFFVDTNTTLNLRVFHEGNANLIPISDDVQNALDDKENYLNLPSASGMILSSDTSGNRSWITPPQGVTDHELLTGRDKADSHPISAVTNLQSSLDSKVNKSGDTMTGNLAIETPSPQVSIIDTDDNKSSRIVNYPTDLYIQTQKSNVIFSDVDGSELKGEVFIKTSSGTHSFYHSGNDGSGSGLDADLLDGYHANNLPISTPVQDALNDKANVIHTHEISDVNGLQGALDGKMDDSQADDYYLKTAFINTSTGATDGGKPIVLNTQGQIDPSMLDVSAFYYVGPWDSSDPDGPNDDGSGCDPISCEYPDTTGESYGAFWFAVLTNPDNPGDDFPDQYYTFQTGELQGKQIGQGDFLVWSAAGWSIMASQMNPLFYMRVDKVSAFLDNGNPLIVHGVIQNVHNGVSDTDAVNLSQLNSLIDTHSHEISDVINLQPELDSKVNKIGDTMTGSLVIDTTGETYVCRVKDDTFTSEQYKDKFVINDSVNEYTIVSDETRGSLRLKVNNITGIEVFESLAPYTPHQPTDIGHLTRKDYVDAQISNHNHEISDVNGLQGALDSKENSLGNPASNGEVLTSLTDGTREWKTIQDIVPQYPSMLRQRFIGDGSTTTFPTDESFTPDNADVYYNGVKILTPEDVNISSGSKLVFTEAPQTNDIIEFVGFKVPVTVIQP